MRVPNVIPLRWSHSYRLTLVNFVQILSKHKRQLMQMAHSIITKAFSPAVIIAGVTTCDDVRWWMREEILKLGLAAGFHPSFSIHRRGAAGKLSGNTVIVPCSFSTMNSAVLGLAPLGCGWYSARGSPWIMSC